MKKTGVIILSTAAVAAGVKLWLDHLDEKERAKWKKYWDERHAEAAVARDKAVAAVKEAAEKGKKEVSETYQSVSDSASEAVKNAAEVVNPADKKDEVLEEMHGALTNYLDSKKDEEASEKDSDSAESEGSEEAVEDSEPEGDVEADSDSEETSEESEKAEEEEKEPAPPVDGDSDEEPLPAWDTVPVIGEGEGQIAPNSDEYVILLKEAIEKAEAEPTYHLVLGGKTYGLGAKGKSIGGDTAYDLDDLRKLLRKAEQGTE